MTQKIWYSNTILVFLLVVVGGFYMNNTKFATSFEEFFPKDSATWSQYQKYTDLFGEEDRQLMIALYHSPSIYDTAFLIKVKALSDSIRLLAPTENILSPTSLTIPIFSPIGSIYSSLLSLDAPSQLYRDSIRLAKLPVLHDQLLASDDQGVLISILLSSDVDEAEEEVYYQQVINLMEGQQLKGDLIGHGYLEYSFKQIMKEELVKVALWSLAFIVLILFFLLRNLGFVFISLTVIIASFLLFYGIIGLTAWKINILGNLYPTIILILGISDCIHFLLFYESKIKNGLTPTDAVLESIRAKGWTLFITSFTTFLGFATLAFADMPALAQFGLQAGLGVMITFAVTMGLLPGILSFFPLVKGNSHTGRQELGHPYFYRKYQFLESKPVLKAFGVLFSVLFIGIGIALLDMNNNLLKSIPTKNGISASYQRFESSFGGYRKYAWVIKSGNERSILDLSNLEKIGEFHAFLDSIPEVAKTISTYSYFTTIQKIRYPGNSPSLPTSDDALKRLDRQFNRSKNTLFRDYIVDSTNTSTTIQVITKDVGRQSIESGVIIPGSKWLQQHFPLPYTIMTTSRDLLIDEGHKTRINSMYSNLAIAIIAIAVILGLTFKSWKVPIVALIANLLPLLFVAALMGYLGIELRGTTSIIFMVGFVIAVDDSIHFLSSFWYRYQHSKFEDALEQTFAETGQAIFWTTVILIGGFSVLIISPFWDISIHGVLISLTLIIALLMDLLVLPVFLKIFFDDE